MSLLRHAPISVPGQLLRSARNSRLGIGSAVAYLLYFSNIRIRITATSAMQQVYSQELLDAAHGQRIVFRVPCSTCSREKFAVSNFAIFCVTTIGPPPRSEWRAGRVPRSSSGRICFLARLAPQNSCWLDKIPCASIFGSGGFAGNRMAPGIKLGYNAPTLDWTNALMRGLGDLHAVRQQSVSSNQE